MRVISGEGSGDERSEFEASLLRLAARCNLASDEQQALQLAVDGIETALDVTCFAVKVSALDGTLKIAAYTEANAEFAVAVNAMAIPLAADALVSQAILSATWTVQREANSQERLEVLGQHPDFNSIAAVAAVPLIASSGTLGALTLFARRDTAFSARHMEALMSFARLLAEDMSRRAQRTILEAQREERSLLLEEARLLDEELSEGAVTRKAAEFVWRTTGARFAVVWKLRANQFAPALVLGDDEGFSRSFTANADSHMPIGQSPLGRAARSGEITYAKDAVSDRMLRPWSSIIETHRVRSMLAIPLTSTLTARSPIVLELYSDDVDAFSDETLALLEVFLPHAQRALQNALLADELRSLARDRGQALTASSGISRGLEEAEVVRSIARVSAESLGAMFAIVYLGEDGGLRVAGSWNAPADLPPRFSLASADPSLRAYPPVQAVREAHFVTRGNVTHDHAWIRMGWEQLAREYGFHAVSAYPLLKGDKALGAVALFYADQTPAPEFDPDTLRQLGTQAGAAVDAARTHEQAKSARNFLDRILEESNDAIIQFDLRGAVVAWNKGAERIFGMTRDEAVGSLFYELPIIPPAKRDDIRELLSRVGRGEEVRVFEVECRSREGRPVEVLLSASPARDNLGQIVGLVAFSKDISEQKKQAEQLQRQNKSLIIMRDVVRTLTREIGLGAICNKGLEKLLEVLRLDTGRLYTLDPDERLHNVAQRGFAPEGTEPISARPASSGDEGALSSCIAYRQTLLTDDGVNHRLEFPYFSARTLEDVSAVITKPLIVGPDVIGAIQVIAFDGRHFTVEDQSVFHAVTDELAIAMRHAHTLEETSRMAITDPLTGLYNYRFTQDFLRKRLSESRRRKRPVSIVMADVDGLAAINDRYGHDVGDDVLREFGRCLASSVRLSDVVARYGGDEFLVLLPETQLSDAVMLAERMAQSIAQHDWQAKGVELTVTASLGCASFPEAGSQMQMLLKAADAALYHAKQAGKNMVYPKVDTLPRFAG